MIDVIHVDEKTAIRTTVELIKALGDKHELSELWIIALRKEFGLIYRPDRLPIISFSKPV